MSNFELFCEKTGEFVVLSWETLVEAMIQGESTRFRGGRIFYCVHFDRGSFGASCIISFA